MPSSYDPTPPGCQAGGRVWCRVVFLRYSALVVVVALVAMACSDEPSTTTAGTAGATSSTGTGAQGGDAAPLAPPTSRAPITTTAPTTTTTAPLGACEGVIKNRPVFKVSAQDPFFRPDCVALSIDQGLNIVNEGEVVHNFTLQRITPEGLEELQDFGNFEPGENNALEPFTSEGGPGVGSYRLYCKIHETAGMEAFIGVA